MAFSDEDQLYKDLEIRDTADHDSIESISGEFTAKTIFIQNQLNQDITCQLQGARNSVWVDVDDPFVITKETNDYQTVTDYFPKYQIKTKCLTDPTAGNLNMWMIKALS